MAKAQPNSRDCFVCGMRNSFGLKLRFYEDEPGKVTANYVVPEHYQGYPGVVHGGIVAAMLDEAAGRAVMACEANRFMYTARLDVRYRQNVPIGEPLRLEGSVVKVKQRTASASCQLFGAQGKLLAEADVLLVEVPREVFAAVDPESLGWQVYPE